MFIKLIKIRLGGKWGYIYFDREFYCSCCNSDFVKNLCVFQFGFSIV